MSQNFKLDNDVRFQDIVVSNRHRAKNLDVREITRENRTIKPGERVQPKDRGTYTINTSSQDYEIDCPPAAVYCIPNSSITICLVFRGAITAKVLMNPAVLPPQSYEFQTDMCFINYTSTNPKSFVTVQFTFYVGIDPPAGAEGDSWLVNNFELPPSITFSSGP